MNAAAPIAEPSPGAGSSDPVTGREHFVGLDGLRGVAAMIVVFAHSLAVQGIARPQNFFLAVDFFFILSGFVVAHAYDQRLVSRSLSLSRFVRLRVVRLHPMLVVATVVALAGRIADGLWQTGALPIPELAMATLTGLLCIPYHTTRGDPAAFTLNGPQWSLFAEYAANLAYALVAPVLGFGRLIAIVAIGALMIVATVAIKGTLDVGWQLSDWPLSLVRVVFPFFLGVLFARLHRTGRLPTLRLPWIVQAVMLAAVLLAPAGSFSAVVQLIAVLLIFPAIILAGRSGEPNSAAWMLWAGAISYPIYILHYPVVRGIARLLSPRLDPLWLVPLQIVVVLIFAHLALKLVDEPVRRWLGGKRRR